MAKTHESPKEEKPKAEKHEHPAPAPAKAESMSDAAREHFLKAMND